MRSGSGYGKGLSNMPFTKLNIAVFAPIASAMVAIATAEKARTVAKQANGVTKVVKHAGRPYSKAAAEPLS